MRLSSDMCCLHVFHNDNSNKLLTSALGSGCSPAISRYITDLLTAISEVTSAISYAIIVEPIGNRFSCSGMNDDKVKTMHKLLTH